MPDINVAALHGMSDYELLDWVGEHREIMLDMVGTAMRQIHGLEKAASMTATEGRRIIAFVKQDGEGEVAISALGMMVALDVILVMMIKASKEFTREIQDGTETQEEGLAKDAGGEHSDGGPADRPKDVGSS
jgi:hypothetical protein